MTSRADVETFRKATASLSERAQRDVTRLFSGLDPLDRIGTRDALLEFLPDVVTAYGESAASVAADYYENVRAGSGVESVYTPSLAGAAPDEQVAASTRWALNGLFVADDAMDVAAVLGNLHKVTDRLVKKPGRDTLAGAIHGDPEGPRFARIPTGPKTCRFCATLASRGAVYLSQETAGGLTDFHDHCDCAVTPIFDGMPLPQGYDPDHYRRLYQDNGGARQDFRKGNRTNRDAVLDTAPSAPGRTAVLDRPTTPDLLDLPAAPEGFEDLPRHAPGDLLAEADEVNPFYGVDKPYGINCQFCTTASEMRARGFDVEALPNLRDGSAPYLTNPEIPKRWIKADGTRAEWEAFPKSKAELDAVVMAWPEGARGTVSVVWKGTTSGHIFNVMKKDGKAVYVDAQPAIRRGDAIAPDFEKEVSWKARKWPGAQVMRLDDKVPDASLVKQLRPRGSHRPDSREERLAFRDKTRAAAPIKREYEALLRQKSELIRKRDSEILDAMAQEKKVDFEALDRKYDHEIARIAEEAARVLARFNAMVA